MSVLFQFLIKLYRYTLSPILGGQCRFHPSCSVYAEHAIAKYGAWEGGWMAIKRLVKCHPWNDGGYDPVP